MSDPAFYTEEMPVTPAADAASVPPPDAMKRVYRVLSVLAPLSIVIAVAVNWLSVPDARQALPSPAGVGRPGVPGIGEVKLAKAAIRLVPERIVGYECITHQAIPGFGNRAGEAVYKTLSMNIEAQIAIVNYCRVEGFSTSAEAQSRLDEFMRPYTNNVHKKTLGKGTVATVAESNDRGTRIVGWVRGPYCTIVKTSFSDYVPAQEVGFKYRNFQNDQVVDGVDVFQLSGREGINK